MTAAQTAKPVLNYNVVPMTSGLLLILDFICLLLALLVSISLYDSWLAPQGISIYSGSIFAQAALIAAVPALFVLYDKHFGAIASRGNIGRLLRGHFMRFMVFAGFVLVLDILSPTTDRFPVQALLIWVITGLVLTSFTRLLVAYTVRRYQQRGALTEVIAVVGAGPVADRLVQALQHSQAETVELLGVFDDKILNAPPSTIKSVGTIAQLLELGKTRKIDWILLTLPPTAERRVLEIIQRLKALSVPIGLCPQHVGLTVPYRIVDFVGNTVPVSLLADRPSKRRDAVLKSTDDFLPRWIITLMLLPVVATKILASKLIRSAVVRARKNTVQFSLQFDSYDTAKFTELAARYGYDQYGYVVTPNVDHIIRLHEDASFRALYADAAYTLLDSRFLSHLMRISKRLHLPVCTGSDLTENILSNVVNPDDSLVLIGGTEEQAQQLCKRYNLSQLQHFNPPMGFIRDPQMIETCLQFIERHSPFRFCFLAVGSPQQEILAKQLKARGIARGLALCIGASINFLTGDEQRAPLWMQQSGTEWLYRLLQAPRRMTRRYLIRGPRIFRLLFNTEIMLREVSLPVPGQAPSAPTQPEFVQAAESIYLQPLTASNQTELSAVTSSSG